jgi:gamma-glutamyltranspeptidase/glutathione hydrolase
MKNLNSLAAFFTVILIFFSGCSDSEDGNVGVVSAGSPEAVSAGLDILKQGGNAVDASIAVAFALGVTEPAQSGLGGQAQFLIYRPGEEPIIINGTSFSPSHLPENISKKDLVKHKATTVPSMVKVLDYLWKNYSENIKQQRFLQW